MKTQKPLYRLLTVLLIVVLSLSSCGIIVLNDGSQTTDTEETEITLGPPTGTFLPSDWVPKEEIDGLAISQNRLEALPSGDLNGLSTFVAVEAETGNFWNDEEGLYVLPLAIRNTLVSEKYNTRIISQYRDAATLLAEIRASDKANDYYADLAVFSHITLGTYSSGGYIYNLNSLPHTDYSAVYYDQEAMAQLTVGGVVYAAVGEATAQMEQYACLYVNRTLGEHNGVTVDYDALYNGSFTWESLLASMKALPEEIPVFTTTYDRDTFAVMTYYSQNKAFLMPDENGRLASVGNTTATADLVALIKQILPLRVESLSLPSTESGDETAAAETTVSGWELFTGGHTIYTFGLLGDMTSLENVGFRWEVMPYPKQTESEEYGTPVHNHAPVMAALTTGENIDTVGYILQALHAASHDYLHQAFYDAATQRWITGAHTLDMIDLIRENPIYDYARMFGVNSSTLREGTFRAYFRAITENSSTDTCFKRYEKQLKNYLNSLK
ncbi:MAG: extracellular solute-binding protein [Ruminococcaceae bacterium]|nr:extracellular solute-binding protein [Oscillospiraceae bacterium]